MSYYTFRHIFTTFDKRDVYECCKWGDHKAPEAVYRVVVSKRSMSCNCFSRGNCKHMECVKDIIETQSASIMHEYIWSYENGWEEITDMVLEET